MIFGSIFGGILRLVLPVCLIAMGLIILLHAVRARGGANRYPQE
jgi:cell division protein FtsB